MVANLSPAMCGIVLAGVWARQWIRGRELLLLAGRDRHGIVIPPAAMAVRSVSYSGLVFVEPSKIEAGDISPTNVGAVHVSTKTSRWSAGTCPRLRTGAGRCGW